MLILWNIAEYMSYIGALYPILRDAPLYCEMNKCGREGNSYCDEGHVLFFKYNNLRQIAHLCNDIIYLYNY